MSNLEFFHNTRIVVFIKNSLNEIDFNYSTLDDAESIILNLISEIFDKIYINKNLTPLVETELNYNEGLITTTITFPHNQEFCIFTQL